MNIHPSRPVVFDENLFIYLQGSGLNTVIASFKFDAFLGGLSILSTLSLEFFP